MKIARCLVLALLVPCALLNRARADSSDGGATVEVDQDGIPLSVSQPQQKQPTPEEVEAAQKMQEQAAKNKDWLLQAYEKERQLHADSSDPNSDLYYRISSNKELAGLAGLPVLEAKSKGQAGGSTDSPQSTRISQPDATPAPPSTPSYGLAYKPLITPLGEPEAAGLHNFYASLPATAIPGSSAPPTAPAPQPPDDQDPTAIDTPGLVAAEKDPLTDKASANLTFDLLAQPNATQDTPPAKLELPLPTNIAQLHKAQDTALSAPGAVQPAQTTTTAVKSAPPPPQDPDPNEPTPIDKMPQPDLIRSPIADPHDIFYR